MELISQKMRKLAPELDPLRIGTGWKPEDLDKPQIMIESTFGDSHPGSGHLNLLVEEVRKGVGGGRRVRGEIFCNGYLRRRKPGNRRHQFQSGKPGDDCQHDRDSRQRHAL